MQTSPELLHINSESQWQVDETCHIHLLRRVKRKDCEVHSMKSAFARSTVFDWCFYHQTTVQETREHQAEGTKGQNLVEVSGSASQFLFRSGQLINNTESLDIERGSINNTAVIVT
ncbi:hypothetical protein UY3_07005 [Chelonia mydas]|uniref:Uncharacterized protein n=1 Tax=Chelonia mydas TaxID=8469 RepID=M7BUL3_CHEMY|nr:hypothetical protein UY3_07005 [Chelonia mydas]